MTLVIAGERSGVGKTTITLALLAYLKQQNIQVQSFKVGPDYIDPMFHQWITGRPCRNLDPVLTSEAYVQHCFRQHTQTVTHALVEGVMGLFDGAADRQDYASTAHIARLLNLPILLVLDCSRLSHSIAALVHGYRSFDSRLQFAGVVLNRVGSDRHLQLLLSALKPLNIPVLGVFHRQDSITIPDRHLGLVPTSELHHLHQLFDQLAHLAATSFDWQQLMPLIQHRGQQVGDNRAAAVQAKVRVAIAQDAAFNFYYADNLDLLQQLGAELVPWSPLADEALPEGIQGLYLGGGFPEVFAQQLAKNQVARHGVRAAIQAGLPTYAECGGLMYLCQNVIDFSGQSFPMVGVLPTDAVMGKRLTLGYRQAIAQHSTPLVPQGQLVAGHEFHRSSLTRLPENPLFAINNQQSATRNEDLTVLPSFSSSASSPTFEGWSLYQLHASYIHLHWGGCPALPARFLRYCRHFKG